MSLILLMGCSRKFYYATDDEVDKFGAAVTYDMDDSYQLYTRQVVTVMNKDSVRVPVNGRLDENSKLLEVEYMFVSARDKKVLVINNIANRSEKYYNSPDKINDLGITADTLKADIWYFAQFRFGVIDPTGEFFFHKTSRDGLDHYWNITRFSDSILLNSISVSDNYGRDVRYIDSAFSLSVVFVKSDPWKLIFKKNSEKPIISFNKKKTIPEYELAGQTIQYHINNGSPVVVFRFNTDIHKDFRNVYFNKKRIYVAP